MNYFTGQIYEHLLCLRHCTWYRAQRGSHLPRMPAFRMVDEAIQQNAQVPRPIERTMEAPHGVWRHCVGTPVLMFLYSSTLRFQIANLLLASPPPSNSGSLVL